MLRVWSDVLLAADIRQVTLLLLTYLLLITTLNSNKGQSPTIQGKNYDS